MDTYYIKHYFDLKNAGSFLLVSFAGLFVVLSIILISAKIRQVHRRRNMAQEQIVSDMKKNEHPTANIAESFYELVSQVPPCSFSCALLSHR